ncbi:phosphatase PAP2 family protein [Lacicoccus alkaliphilus]|uniref:Undecaprenyl-diphosphatase n=2 Tax=Lacicoccus TaxID=3076172 RepID=A0A1M7HIV5_9BACL|nr:phosphatase PAP2 family protein [Salinicoccus alkaliphilus]SHM28426.1 undecaprenyl-diphosphatase [Salinicoccus alkaliphilus DSM 16010]
MISNRYRNGIMMVSLGIFIIVTFLSLQHHTVTFDRRLISWITETTPGYASQLMSAVTILGSGEVIVILTFIIFSALMLYRRFEYALMLLMVSIGGIALNFLLKILFQRERPGDMTVIEMFGFSLEVASFSFPSGHTMRSVLLFSFLILLTLRHAGAKVMKVVLTLMLLCLMSLIAISRILVDMHFPTDILAAVSISIFWFFACLGLTERLMPQKR